MSFTSTLLDLLLHRPRGITGKPIKPSSAATAPAEPATWDAPKPEPPPADAADGATEERP